MFSRIRVQVLLLVFVITGVSFPALSALVESSSTHSASPEKTLIGQNNQKSLYQKFLDILVGRRQNSGTRGDGFCSIWPDKDRTDSLLTWSDRPLFAWEGEATRIEVYDSDWKLMWGKDVTKEVQQITYPDDAENKLISGQEYTYIVSYKYKEEDGKTISTKKQHSFQVVDSEKSASLQEGLTILENQIQNLSDEEKAMERANYFAQQEISLPGNSNKQKLWADVFRELFSVSSLESTEAIKEIRSKECHPNHN
ncbi:MAG TPA: hypothetical protein DEG17_26615 [Cyanobacteria bacterium UBA11149]|nr:hypothetical protein [Cyanobacteria bacterium UBA11366]HBK62459.1 hypothetical protein [Cyanobacteria bacterium UBA11166]HBR72601.1 hypothetical protein [Cyanobacteria bacterium UBA11159]HBS71172.1 hypothetical protein [Cyanobacteria bacterium UBA11153]HBW92342.1 hypothetical protein [Cyanobacteria bacterium UBA11149]HCA96372.1 hypothetical protein [Cyanobacteria bacterium UBA9226]